MQVARRAFISVLTVVVPIKVSFRKAGSQMTSFMVGNSERFAIETHVEMVVPKASQLALGYFAIHINGTVYGVREPDATLLACSYDLICSRLGRRGMHLSQLATNYPAEELVRCIQLAIYEECPPGQCLLGMSPSQLLDELTINELILAPDGDEAFDDGSNIIQFDVGERVRIVGFKNWPDEKSQIGSISEIYMPTAEFYEILECWREEFLDVVKLN